MRRRPKIPFEMNIELAVAPTLYFELSAQEEYGIPQPTSGARWR